MKKRIGNDITFTWHIYRKDGETQVPESFTGKEVEVRLISPLQRPVTIENVSIATGVVTFTFRGKHQVTLGNYVAVLLENKGENGMVTLDVVNAVTLVPHSYMEEDGDEGDVIEAEAVELTSTISAGSGGGIEQQQADWAQTDDTAVDFIKNKPNLDLYCRKDADNTHSDGVSDTFAKLVYDEHNPSVLMQADRLTVGGDSIKFYHSHRGEDTKELSLKLDDVEKLKDLPTNSELITSLAGKQATLTAGNNINISNNVISSNNEGWEHAADQFAVSGTTAYGQKKVSANSTLDITDVKKGTFRLYNSVVYNGDMTIRHFKVEAIYTGSTVTLYDVEVGYYETKELSFTVNIDDDCTIRVTNGLLRNVVGFYSENAYKEYTKTLATVGTTGSYNDLGDKPDLSAFITNSVDDLINYYLKSETYTKTEVQQLIGAIQQFHYEVYPTLPQTGASNVLYLIGPTGTGTDKYEEYVYANNTFTKIGDTSIDLSGYVTTQALNTALADYVTSSALSTALAGKADKSEMSVVPGTGANADKTTITLKQGTSATVLTAHQDISGKENITPIEAVASGTTTITAQVNKYYEVAGTVSSLTITLPTPTVNTEVTMVVVHLTVGASPTVIVTSVNEVVKFSAAYSVVANKEYELSCLYNGSKWIVSSMEVAA